MTACHRIGWVSLSITWLCFSAGGVIAETVADVVNRVSETNYQDYLDNQLYTSLGEDRRMNGAEHDLAMTNILDTLESFGLQTALEPFVNPDDGKTYYNVLAVLPGKTARSNEFYIVSAHYDSMADDEEAESAPGADDDASGVAGVLEAARVMSQSQFEATIVFAAFDLEEVGLFGSSAYAVTARQNGQDIKGMISLDMIAWNGSANGAEILCQTNSMDVVVALSNSVTLYGDGLSVFYGGPEENADNYSFESNGFHACLFIEGNSDANPYMHSEEDSVDTPNYIDYAFAAKMTRAAVGYLAAEAGLYQVSTEPTVHIARSPNGKDILLSWPAFASNYSAFVTGEWFPPTDRFVLTNEPVITESNLTVRVPLGGDDQAFYWIENTNSPAGR